MAKYLMDEVPILLKSEDLKSVPQVLFILLESLPACAGYFIKWVLEVRRQEENGSSLSKEEKERLAAKVLLPFPAPSCFPILDIFFGYSLIIFWITGRDTATSS